MSFNRQPNRSPFQQNSRSTPPGNNQRSPQIKKFNSLPAWGSGAFSPSGQYSSPSTYNLTSPPPFNNGHSPSHSFTSPPPQQQFRPPRNQGNQAKSPRHPPHPHQFRPPNFNNYGQFRTPQPMNRYPTSPQKSWSCDRNFRPMSKRLDLKSPRRNPNSNPGGSNDIEQYYHPSMLADPWQKLTPVSVTHTPSITT